MIVSVIVPIYNAEKYLKQMLESILNQSFSDFEVILVDDGSTDHSGEICDEFAETDCRIRVFHIENLGVSNARNYGLAQAKGQYVHFADSDDYIENGMYESFNAAVQRDQPDVVMCGCQQINISKKESTVLSNNKDQMLKNRDEIKDYIDQIEDGNFRCLFHYIWNKWYKRDLLIQQKILYSTELSLGEDFVFNCQVVQAVNSLRIIPESYYHYFIRGSSLVSAFQPEPWITRKIILNARIALYRSYDIFENNQKNIYYEEGKRCFAALRSINSKRCALTSSQKKIYLKKMISSELMQYILIYLKSSPKKLHRLWLFLIQKGGFHGTQIVLCADWIQRQREFRRK